MTETYTAELRTLAVRARERCDALEIRGAKRRGDAILHYFVGAAGGAEACGNTGLACAIGTVAALLIAPRGELGLIELTRDGEG